MLRCRRASEAHLRMRSPRFMPGGVAGDSPGGGRRCTDMWANDEGIPSPLAMREYSGKFLARVPPETHRRLARAKLSR